MISTTIYSERYVRHIAVHNQIYYAEKAHEYPCCDIPTNRKCSNCRENFPCILRRKSKVLVVCDSGRSKPSDWLLASLYGMAMADTVVNYHLKNEMLRPLRRLFPEDRPYKKCLLPGCEEQTSHRGGYCCAEHCKEHKVNQQIRKKGR